jgi:hypothetical protein
MSPTSPARDEPRIIVDTAAKAPSNGLIVP